MKKFYDIIESFAMAVLILTLAIMFFFRIIVVDGDSMLNTLHNQEKIIISNFMYTAEKGDIVVTDTNNGYGKPLIKRIIAIPGDYLWINSDGSVYLNGSELQEPYISEKALGECDVDFPHQVAENHYFMMGDHRETSIDSRSSVIGLVSEEFIVGKIFFRIWPFETLGFVE